MYEDKRVIDFKIIYLRDKKDMYEDKRAVELANWQIGLKAPALCYFANIFMYLYKLYCFRLP